MKIAKLLLVAAGAFYCFGLCGCAETIEFLRPEGPPNYNEATESYRQSELKVSTSADVIGIINLPEYELLSQSRKVLASLGQKKQKGFKTWFKMIAFDENNMTVTRKYLFLVDERPKFLFIEPWTGLNLDCEMVIDSRVLDKPYADDRAKRIEILKQVLKNFLQDIDEVKAKDKMLDICGMMVNQAFEGILVKLESWPAQATRLSEYKGMEFDHINLDKGRIKSVLEEDIVTVHMSLGSFVKGFEKEEGKKQKQKEAEEQN